MLANTKKI